MTTDTQTERGRTAGERVLGVSLSDRALLDLIGDAPAWAFAALHDIVDLTGTGILYLGADRFQPPADPGGHLDPLFAAHALLTRLPSAAALVSTSPDVEHPFNFARRIAGLDHFTRGRIGAVLGTRDRRADRLGGESTPWTGRPTDPAHTADFLTVLRLLLNSWPRETIIADKEHGRFAEVSRIARVDHDGLYSVAGPLNAPSSVQGEPPLGLHRTLGRAEVAAVGDAAEIVLTSERGVVRVLPVDGAAQIGILVTIDTLGDLPRLVARLAEGSPDAQPAVTDSSPEAKPERDTTTVTLRQRLGLAVRTLDLSGHAAAFPVPSRSKLQGQT